MKVTFVGIDMPPKAIEACRRKLIPELMASVGARYSRNNEGLDAILSMVDSKDQDKAVDAIFKHVDYGHRSLMDMVPVSLFMDDISVFLAYYLWAECPVVAGQESSSRYIRMSPEGLIDPGTLGIPESDRAGWSSVMGQSFEFYDEVVAYWTDLSTRDPSIMRIPPSVIADTSDGGQKKLDRMRRNYVFDRARYFVPLAAATNVMMIMSAREWVRLANVLLSHFYSEFNLLGEMILSELDLVCPRLVKHARKTDDTASVIVDDFALDVQAAQMYDCCDLENGSISSHNPMANFKLLQMHDGDLSRSVKHRIHRYSRFGEVARNSFVSFGWSAVTMGEIRDFNRHRTGKKFCPLIPRGFYCAHDQSPDATNLMKYEAFGNQLASSSRELLGKGYWSYIYHTLLGHQYQFSHITSMDNFIYECELRTGIGAHYRYAKHIHDVLELVYKDSSLSSLKGVIFEGSAEPE